MRINVVNPNTTAAMTAKIAAAARAAASPGTEILAVQPAEGPPSIEGYFDEALSVPGLLGEIVAGERAGVAGHVIACFDDTGLDAARASPARRWWASARPPAHLASLVAGRFSVVTTLSRSIPALEHNLVRYGLASRCARVRASEVPVLDLEDAGFAGARRASRPRSRRRSATTGPRRSCSAAPAWPTLPRSSRAEFGVPVVEGVSAAVRLVESLAALGLATSKVGGYAPPRAKAYTGPFAALVVEA